MRFELTEDQQDLAATMDALLTKSDPVTAARAWAEGDRGPGWAIWGRLAELGVPALVVPEEAGGAGASPVELVIALEAVGHHGLPGPYVESAAFLAGALDTPGGDADLLARIAAGAPATVARSPYSPRALDADGVEADLVFVVDGDSLTHATVGQVRRGVDRTRHLAEVRPSGGPIPADLARGLDLAVLATAAQLLGAGERVLADTVSYVKQRRQFGREIGSYQALKHRLADVRIALDFARPLVDGAALGEISPSAAKVQCADAAYLAARTGLQLHGAIGYTEEFDLSIWLTKIRALLSAWGTPAAHRAQLLRELAPGMGA